MKIKQIINHSATSKGIRGLIRWLRNSRIIRAVATVFRNSRILRPLYRESTAIRIHSQASSLLHGYGQKATGIKTVPDYAIKLEDEVDEIIKSFDQDWRDKQVAENPPIKQKTEIRFAKYIAKIVMSSFFVGLIVRWKDCEGDDQAT